MQTQCILHGNAAIEKRTTQWMTRAFYQDYCNTLTQPRVIDRPENSSTLKSTLWTESHLNSKVWWYLFLFFLFLSLLMSMRIARLLRLLLWVLKLIHNWIDWCYKRSFIQSKHQLNSLKFILIRWTLNLLLNATQQSWLRASLWQFSLLIALAQSSRTLGLLPSMQLAFLELARAALTLGNSYSSF